MSGPIPAPRAKPRAALLPETGPKKPIPAPRTLIPIRKYDEDIEPEQQTPLESMENKVNTFGRRVRTLSNVSIQIAEDLGKKAISGTIETTRQSVKKMARRFTTAGATADELKHVSVVVQGENNNDGAVFNMFNEIRFNSPIHSVDGSTESTYENADILPSSTAPSHPPTYPPPPLRPSPSQIADDIYDEPASVASGSSSYGSASEQRHLDQSRHSDAAARTASSSIGPASTNGSSGTSGNGVTVTVVGGASAGRRADYESVFPTEAYNSDSESCVDLTTAQTLERNINLERCNSWNFYDPLPRPATENIYNNVDSTPALRAISLIPSSSNSGQNNDKTPILPTINKDDKGNDVAMRNVYENHEIKLDRSNLPTQSILLQFDPLANRPPTNISSSTNFSSDLHSLAELLDNDLYYNPTNNGNVIPGVVTVHTMNNAYATSSMMDSEEDLTSVNGEMLPPLPPERVDSLPEVEVEEREVDTSKDVVVSKADKGSSKDKEKESLSREQSTRGSGRYRDFKPYKWLTKATEALKKAPDLVQAATSSKPSKDLSLLPRPALLTKTSLTQRGLTFRVNNGTSVEDFFSELNTRWSVLTPGIFISFSDAQESNIKEQIKMEDILSIQMINELKYKHDNEDLFCMEVNVWNKSKASHVYGVKTMTERRVWMQKLAESMTPRFGSSLTSDYRKFGWAYISEGVSGQWLGAWLLLKDRKLHYALDKGPVRKLDLRTARCIVLSPLEAIGNTPKTHDKGPNMIVDCTTGALYVRMWTQRETKAWARSVKMEAHNNGAKLEQQQLTKNGIPVIIEKCINFIYVNGSMSQGIYRKAGNNSKVAELLDKFSKDAWAVQLTTDTYDENDVANALKRFFRDLPEPLFPEDKRQYLIQVSLVKSKGERIRMFKAVLEQLPAVTFNTIRKLLGHLSFISSQSEKNLMHVKNLAAIWGPSLMPRDVSLEEIESAKPNCQREDLVVAQLLELCGHIFPENGRTTENERVMLAILQRCNSSPQGAVNVKTSGEFRMWIYVQNKSGKSHNIAIGPQRTAYEVICELSPKIDIPVHELILEEWVLGENMTRPIHHREKVLNVVLKWGYWDEPDRKDNCLIITKLNKYKEFMDGSITSPMAELKFADCKSKSFKPFMFEFTQANLKYYRDRYSTVELGSWNIEDIVWYLGHDAKRNPPSKYTLTYIVKNGTVPKRTKTEPFFGNCLAWNTPAERALWIRMFLHAEHPTDLSPPAQHVNLMST